MQGCGKSGEVCGILAPGHILGGSQKVVQKYTILAGPVGQRCGKSVVFLATWLFSGGYTKVAQRCDGLAERVGETDAKGGYFRKWHLREGGVKEYTKSTPF